MADKNVIQLLTTATTAGAYLEITIPDGVGGYLSRKIPWATVSDKLGEAANANKGYFLTSAALAAAYPVGENGWFAVVGATDTVWLWDSGTLAWVDSTQTSAVVSVNGVTGAVQLNADDIPYTGLAGLTAAEVSGAIDELAGMIAAIVVGGNGYETHTKDTDKAAGAHTKAVVGGTVVLQINFQHVAGTPFVKVGTSAGADDILPKTEVVTGIYSINTVNQGRDADWTLHLTVSGGTVNPNYVLYVGHYTP